jgi:hypothetical protein
MGEEKTCAQIFDEIIMEMCDKYCKCPAEAEAAVEDPDDAEDYLYNHYCGDCPLQRLM